MLTIAAEAASRIATRSGAIYRRFDFSGALTSLPELRDRVAWADSLPRPLFVLGDSVLGASALFERRAADPRRRTVAAFLGRDRQKEGASAASLGADGLLIPDLEAIARELSQGAPAADVLVVLNTRMFASEFSDPARAISREFLLPDLPDDAPERLAASESGHLQRRLDGTAVQMSTLLRSTRLLQTLWYFPTRRDFFRRLVEGDRPEDSVPIEIRDAALRLKVGAYYRDAWNPDSLAFRSLARLLGELRGRRRVRVVLTPQNPDFVEDAASFRTNRSRLRDAVKTWSPAGVTYLDLADRFSADMFLDHCHLTEEGNREYARVLANLFSS